MKVTQPSRLSREALTDAPAGEYVDRILEKINADAEQTNGALMNNLNFADNMNAAIVKYDLTHGTEKKIPNPLKTRPVGIYAVRAAAINGGTRYAIDSFDWRFVDSGDPKQPQQIGVTAVYAAPLGIIQAVRATAQSIADNTQTAVQWSSATQLGSLSWVSGSNTRITVAAAGKVQSTHTIGFNTAAAGYRQAWVRRSGDTAQNLADVFAVGGNYVGICGTETLDVVVGDYLEVFVLQNSGAPMNLLPTANRILHEVRYVAPPSTAQNTVTLLILGG